MSTEGPSQNSLTQNFSTTNTAQAIPPWITDAQQYALNMAQLMTLPAFANGPPAQQVMGITPDQMLAADLARQAGQFSSNQLLNQPNVLGGPAITASQATASLAGMSAAQQAVAQQAAAQQAAAAQAQAQQLAPGEIAPFMNPYIDAALNPVLARLKQQQQEVQSGIGAQAAASHMYGGSREAVMRSLADRNYRDTLGTTAGNMLHAGWNVASGLASQNADRRQQTALTNAQLQNAINALNAQLGTQTSQINAQLGTQASTTNAQLANQLAALNAQLGTNVSMQNAQLGTQASMAEANRYLTALGLQSQMGAQAINNQLNSLNAINTLGGQQRAIGQQALDRPYEMLKLLTSVTPWTVPMSSKSTVEQMGTGTQTTEQPIDWASIILGGLKLLSDRRLKENIEQVGALPNGLPVYRFNFIGSGVTQLGLMSDEVRKVHPDAVYVLDGYDVVDYSKAMT